MTCEMKIGEGADVKVSYEGKAGNTDERLMEVERVQHQNRFLRQRVKTLEDTIASLAGRLHLLEKEKVLPQVPMSEDELDERAKSIVETRPKLFPDDDDGGRG